MGRLLEEREQGYLRSLLSLKPLTEYVKVLPKMFVCLSVPDMSGVSWN